MKITISLYIIHVKYFNISKINHKLNTWKLLLNCISIVYIITKADIDIVVWSIDTQEKRSSRYLLSSYSCIGNFTGKILTVMFSTAQPVFVCDTLNRILTNYLFYLKKNRFNLSNSGQQQTTWPCYSYQKIFTYKLVFYLLLLKPNTCTNT
jgi:hypothetical protein